MRYVIKKEERPVYLQLYKQLRQDIIDEIFPYNSRLPSKRLLADELGISTITVEHAYALLCDEGYVQSRERSGYFVSFRQTDGFAASASDSWETHERLRTETDYPVFSVSLLGKTMRRVLNEYGDMILEKSPNSGSTKLRHALRQYLARNRGIYVELEQIIIGSGAEYLYRLIVDLLGRDKLYALESPSYEKIEQTYAAAGVRYELLPLSEDGIDGAALAGSCADVLHITPYRSFPSGITASASKRYEYIRWSGKAGRFMIESDYGSEFSVLPKPTETLFALSDYDNVIYLNTFTKTISPALRVGYMVLPKRLVPVFQKRLGFYSCTVPTFEQLVLAELLQQGDFERHINRVRRKKRRELSEKN